MNFFWQLPGCLWMTPACPPVFLLDPDIFVFCMLHLVCLCFKMKVEISWCVGCDGSFVEVSIGNSLNSTATLNRSICYKREHSRTRLRLISTRMATVKLHLSKPDTWNQKSTCRGKSWIVECVSMCVYYYYDIDIYIYTRVHIIEGSLEVKLPTIWTDEKQSREEAERRERLEERRVEEKE